jgi:hypothetical protein
MAAARARGDSRARLAHDLTPQFHTIEGHLCFAAKSIDQSNPIGNGDLSHHQEEEKECVRITKGEAGHPWHRAGNDQPIGKGCEEQPAHEADSVAYFADRHSQKKLLGKLKIPKGTKNL